MKQQMSFAQNEYAGKKKVTRRERFLGEMERVVPWARLCAVIEPHYPQGRRGRPPIGIERMLRIYFLQQWYALEWHVAAKRGKVKAMAEGLLKELTVRLERVKAQVRARVEHPFHILKNLFRHRETRYRGLAKNTAQLHSLFALANLFIARRPLLNTATE